MNIPGVARLPELLSIGRSSVPAGSGEDDGRSEISREHADLIVYADGTMELVDRSSANGTFVWGENVWKRISEATVVDEGSRVRLGELYETDVRQLLAAARRGKGNRIPEKTVVARRKSGGLKWVRNPETGQPEQG